MRVSAKSVERYRHALGQLGEQAASSVLSALVTAQETGVAELRERAIAAIADAIDAQGSVAQALSMQLYDATCMAEGMASDPAQMFQDAIDRDMMMAKVHYFARDLVTGMREKFDNECAELAEYYVRRCAYENTVRNCGANDVRYARVPTGEETCEFCMMLASRGFVYHSEATAKGSHGVHRRCDCIVMPGAQGKTKIEGYDPDEWHARWQESLEGKRTTAESVPNDLLDEFGAIEGTHSRNCDLAATNPRWASGDTAFRVNCQRCCVAYEARRRGINVTAAPHPMLNHPEYEYLTQHPNRAYLNRQQISAGTGNGYDEVFEALKQAGDGARFEVSVRWRQSSSTINGHVFIAENHNDNIRFIDPQTGDDDVSRYFSRAENGYTKYWRIDDAEFSRQAQRCFLKAGEM